MSSRNAERRAHARNESEGVRLARWLEAQPCNRNGQDKTWVLRWLERFEHLMSNVQRHPIRRASRARVD
jgi:hypothetical protein